MATQVSAQHSQAFEAWYAHVPEHGAHPFPMVNASWMGDRITTRAEVYIGVAVAVPDPECAILAVEAVRKLPVVDGALAAQFLNEVRRLLESPVSLFV